MAEFRRLVKIFLGSPGDLQEERKIAKAVADEFNSLLGEKFQCQVDLVGWEDTVSTFGRPQETINKELDRCELFVGIIWKRWGTAPALNSEFSSGFEEEFRRSLANRRKDGRPEISMYFKDVAEELQRDPGDQLKKVLEFKRELIDGKELLFESFSDSRDFEAKFRRCIISYVTNLIDADKSSISDDNKPLTQTSNEAGKGEIAAYEASVFSKQAMHFLERLINEENPKKSDTWTSEISIARLRLISTLIKHPSNDEAFIGTHDSNILFRSKGEIDLGKEEQRGLFDSALEHYRHETAPLWYWLIRTKEFQPDALIVSSLYGTNEQRSGALHAMRLIGEPIESIILFNRDFCIQNWLSDDTATNIKVGALNYLADYGRNEDYAMIRKEFDRSDSQTVSAAANAAICISMRNSRNSALQTLLELRPAVVSRSLVNSMFSKNPNSIEPDLLISALSQPNVLVRRAAVIAARQTGLLTNDLANSLLEDSDAEIRLEALQYLASYRTYTLDEARSILVKPNKNTLLAGTDQAGDKAFMDYQYNFLASLPIDDLERNLILESMFDIDTQIALAAKNFSKYGQILRSHVDDFFANYFENKLHPFIEKYGIDSDLVKTMRGLKEFTAKKHVKKALDFICLRNDPADLGRVRSLISSDYIEASDVQITYLGKFGEWQDIDLVNKVISKTSDLLAIFSDRSTQIEVAADTLLKLGNENLSELFATDLPSRVLPRLILKVPEKQFASLDQSVLLFLLNNSSDRVRKAAALKCLRSLKRSDLVSLLDKYLKTDTHFYNVVHWLDMGISLPQKTYKISARKCIDNFFSQ
jgi:hypothetical protein